MRDMADHCSRLTPAKGCCEGDVVKYGGASMGESCV